jgi:hypothetical protein
MKTDSSKSGYDEWLNKTFGGPLPVLEGWDPVEFFRQVRTKQYKEENGLPCDEETEYIERVRRSCNEQSAAFHAERKKRLASGGGGGYSQVAEPAAAYG